MSARCRPATPHASWRTPSTRRLPIVLVACVVLLTTFACGDDGDDDASSDQPDAVAAAACREQMNDRNRKTFSEGSKAGVDVLAVLMGAEGDGEVAEDERGEHADKIEAYRDELVDTQDALDDVELGAEHADDWETIVDSVDPTVAALDERVEVLRSDSDIDLSVWPRMPGPGRETRDALEALELVGRDCEFVYGYWGPPAASVEFVTGAADVCAAVVERRRAEGYQADTETALDMVIAVRTDEDAPDEATLTKALEDLLTEWEQTKEDFESVDADDVPDPDVWEETIAVTQDRIDGTQQRLDAIESGDEAAIEAAFTPGEVWEHPGFPDMKALGLDQRDCRSIAT